MKKKVLLFVFIGALVFSVTGCTLPFLNTGLKNKIVGYTFVHEVKTDGGSSYGDLITSQTLIFYKDNKGTSKIDLEFTGKMKEYAEKYSKYETRHTSSDFTYTVDDKEGMVEFTTDSKYDYKLKYDSKTKCLVDTTNSKIQFCRK